jgi:hypothetical protein
MKARRLDGQCLGNARKESVRRAGVVGDRRDAGGLVGGDEVAVAKEDAYRGGADWEGRGYFQRSARGDPFVFSGHPSLIEKDAPLVHGDHVDPRAGEHLTNGTTVGGAYAETHGSAHG